MHEAKSHLEEIKEHLSGQVATKPEPMLEYKAQELESHENVMRKS